MTKGDIVIFFNYMSKFLAFFSLHMELKHCPAAPSVSPIRRDLVPLWDEQPQPVDGGGPGDDLSRRVDTGAAALLPPHHLGGVAPFTLLRSVASSLCLSSPSQVKYLAGHGGLLFAVLWPGWGCESAGVFDESAAPHLTQDQPEVDSPSLRVTKCNSLVPLYYKM